MTLLSRTRAIALVIAVGLLGACGESDSRQRNSALSGPSPTSVNILVNMPLPEVIASSGDSVIVASGLGGPMARINDEGVVVTPSSVTDPVSGILANPDGTFFVANQTLSQVRKIGLEGQILQTFPLSMRPDAVFRGVDNTLIVVVGRRGIVRINLDNGATEEVGEISEMVHEIDVDRQGNIYLHDRMSNQLLKIAPDGTETTIPWDLPLDTFTVDDSGNLHALVRDTDGVGRLVIVKTDGSQTIRPLNQRIVSTASLVIGDDGTTYIIDSWANAVHRVLPGGDVHWMWAETGSGPRYGAFTKSGALFVTNMNSNSVTKITPAQNVLEAPPSSSNELRPGQTPMFGTTTPTRDGFTVPIMNFDPEFTYVVSADQGTAIVSTGMVQVFGLSPNSVATLTVVAKREGYADADAQISARSLEAIELVPDAPASANDDESTTSVDDTTTSSVADETSTSMAPAESSIETSSSLETSSSVEVSETPAGGEPAEVVQTQTESGINNVLAVPSAVIVEAVRKSESSSPVPVLVSPETTEIVCDQGCLTALLAATDMFGATVTASVPGLAPVAITLDNVTPIAIGSNDTAITFELTDADGKKVAVEVPVVHDESVSYLTADASSGSSNRTWLIVLLVVALVILMLLVALQRRRQERSVV